MKGAGRKNLKRATEETHVSLEDGQSIAQVISLRGSNLIEVMDARGEKSIALFPAKFQKSIWMKQGSFVVVDGNNVKEKDKEKSSKVSCMVCRVLFHEQVRMLQKTSEWPEIFKPTDTSSSGVIPHTNSDQQENEIDASDDEGLPPLEANRNRWKPFDLHSDDESIPSSDSDS